MKLKKIIIKKYDKDLKIFIFPPVFTYRFVSLESVLKFKFDLKIFLEIGSQFEKVDFPVPKIHLFINKVLNPFFISSEALSPISIYSETISRHKIEFCNFLHSWTTPVLVHCFFFYTYFYKTFSESRFFRNEIDNVAIQISEKFYFYSFKNFYFPFIYFLAFKSLEV